MDKFEKAWKKYEMTNESKDFADWLLTFEKPWQVKQFTLVAPDGTEMKVDCKEHKRFKAFIKMIKKTKADQ
ncbi:hypothetical protein EKK58_08625 [Candidatus Dependentiae bacterium]|nr:MAG: hypothetical protein EKK58_08625 [Candidatus Dependentiae bacterium]